MIHSLQIVLGPWIVHMLVSILGAWFYSRYLNSKVLGAILGFVMGTITISLLWSLGAPAFFEYFENSWEPFDYFDPARLNYGPLYPASAAFAACVGAYFSRRRAPEDTDLIRRLGDKFQKGIGEGFRLWRVRIPLAIGIAVVIANEYISSRSMWDYEWWPRWGFGMLTYAVGSIVIWLAVLTCLGVRFLKREDPSTSALRLLDEWARRSVRMKWTWILMLAFCLGGAWRFSVSYSWESEYTYTCRHCGIYNTHVTKHLTGKTIEIMSKPTAPDWDGRRVDEPHEHRWRGTRCSSSSNIWGGITLWRCFDRSED